ncbi:GDSL-like Lipase/Acylhydrolase [Aquisphaera giovannonii]|uniref:GDSL-like Lipase/Acylhydrolase n=1 Tax=Aquisphaera giovannonii TaxID=406548 RepID=A0A5B9W1K4_9BACT|nr:SGNH/GDSL hydrolase family protein [Aquisphaera giovannonii]QEH34408.1 GDSL-like Lipase/Acylhydrolase [Aquisphaera giovannonii]
MKLRHLAAIVGIAALVAPAVARGGEGSFYLKDGDRVVFYGDSITDQLLYTTYTETFVVTRFPRLNLTFTHSGWGGDRVGGGAGGSIDRRLARDVVAYRPTVVTIMLGMNDASYRPFQQDVFDRYASGYRHIVDELKSDLPGVRLTLIRPSPYDDVTREPKFEGGYNAVLLRYADFVSELAKSSHCAVADLNAPLVEATKKAAAIDKEKATAFNPDRVHPSPAGQLIMAQSLLRAWNAPSLVSAVSLDAKGVRIISADNAEVTNLARSGDALTWTQLDKALPFPISHKSFFENLDFKDPTVALAVKTSDFFSALDRQPLKVDGLDAAAEYTLSIDGTPVGTFSTYDLGSGVNLAEYNTPMTEQALAVHHKTIDHTQMHKYRWREIQMRFQDAPAEYVRSAVEGLDGLERTLVAEQHALAQPRPHKFELKPKAK